MTVTRAGLREHRHCPRWIPRVVFGLKLTNTQLIKQGVIQSQSLMYVWMVGCIMYVRVCIT